MRDNTHFEDPSYSNLNLGQNFLQGYQVSNEAAARKNAMDIEQRKLAQQQAVMAIGQEAARTGDPKTIAMFSALNPEGGKAIRENAQYYTKQGTEDLLTLYEAKITDKPALYSIIYPRLKANPYHDTSKFPDPESLGGQWDPATMNPLIKADLNKGRDLDRSYSLQDTGQGIKLFESKTGTAQDTPYDVYKKPPSTVINMDNREESSFYKKFGETKGTEYANLLATARKAGPAISKLDRAESLLNKLGTTGKFTPSVANIGNVMNQTGLFKIDLKKVGNIEELSQLSKDQAGAILASGEYGQGTGISSTDLKAAQDRVFSADKTIKGNLQIIDSMRRVHKRAVDAGKIINTMTSKNAPLGDIEDALQTLENKPLFDKSDEKKEKTLTSESKQPKTQNTQYQEGVTATNPNTGQTLTFRGGKWQ